MKFLAWLPVVFVVVGACGGQSTVVTAALTNACPGNIPWMYPPVPPLNTAIWQYSKTNLGRQVGDGQCAELPDVALKGFGAYTFYDLGPSKGNDVDYVWGDLVEVVTPGMRLVNVLPGDVVQFANADFKWQVSNNGWYTAVDTHHTAVVEAVSADGANLCVFQQNAGGKLFVTYGFYEVSGMTQGVLHVYRPRAKR